MSANRFQIIITLLTIVIISSCRVLLTDKSDIINTGTETTYFVNNPQFSVSIPGSFKFLDTPLRCQMKKIMLFGYDKYLFSIRNQPRLSQDNKHIYSYQLICLYSKSINELDQFSEQTLSKLKKLSNIDSLKFLNAKSIETEPLTKSFSDLSKKNKFNVLTYLKGNSTKSKYTYTIEYHIKIPNDSGVLRFLWIEDLKKINSEDPQNISAKSSAIFESSKFLSSIKFGSEQYEIMQPFGYSNYFFTQDYHYDYYLPIKFLLRDSSKFANKGGWDRDIFYQALITQYSLAGDYNLVSYYDNKLIRPQDSIIDYHFDNYNPILAKQYILKQYKNADFLLFNEVHHWPQCRAFVRDLLPDLYASGFRYLALEDIDIKGDPKIFERGYPIQESGYYVPEPVYGQLVREAFRLGFKIIAYEDTTECKNLGDNEACFNQRDLNQAKNILQYLKQNPKGKTIVLGGYDHIYKAHNDKMVSMAENLKTLSNQNVISIDQTKLVGKYDAKNESHAYKAIEVKYLLSEPSFLVNRKDSTNWVGEDLKSKVDAEIFFPYQKNLDMPDWVFPSNAKEVEIKLKNYHRNVFFQVFIKKEYGQRAAIPYFNYLVSNGLRKIKIKIQPGIDYIWLIKDPYTNAVLNFNTVKVY